jgi:hypothetical protein
MNNKTIFFGVGSGRCGTMAFSNFLNSENNSICLHEGKIRQKESSKNQVLPFLTLQNYYSYENPNTAFDTFAKTRSMIPDLCDDMQCSYFGDIAYNYAPFVGEIPKLFPGAKLIYFYRNGIEFVRSVITDQIPDPTPVGWLNRKMHNKVERFISLGRLRPSKENELFSTWKSLSEISKNAWLWSETNSLILTGIEKWPENLVHKVCFEKFKNNPLEEYKKVRSFLGLSNEMSQLTQSLFKSPINNRSCKVLPKYKDWTPEMKSDFNQLAGNMMSQLGYHEDK